MNFIHGHKELLIRFVVVLVVIIAIVIVAAVVFTTEPIVATVIGHNWTREIQIENYAPRQREDWNEAVPLDAYAITCWSEVRSYRTDRSCSGSGEDRVCTEIRTAVWDTRCGYTVDRWMYNRSLVSSGNERADYPYWRELDFAPCNSLYCERTSQYNQWYNVEFSYVVDDTEREFQCPIELIMWNEYRNGDRYTLEMGKFIRIPRCEKLRREF